MAIVNRAVHEAVARGTSHAYAPSGRATKTEPNAEGHCTTCAYVKTCELYKEAYGERDMPILRK